MRILTVIILFLAANAFAQETQIKGFLDMQGGYQTIRTDTTQKAKTGGFKVGQFDLFITSQIDDKTTFLGETVFEYDAESKSFVVDVERMIVRRSFYNELNLGVGKYHTPFGYWNNAYHHGALLQPTIQRPNIVRFEDEGGFLPVHQVGIQLDGGGIGGKNFGYNLFVSNGQADGNSGGDFTYSGSPAFSGSVNIEPIENLKVIGSAFYNTVPAGSTTYQGVLLAQDSKYQMLNATVAYFNGKFPIEFVAEFYSVNNSSVGSSHTMNGGFLYFGYTQLKLIPYIVYNNIQFEQDEKYFNDNDLSGYTAGLRYNPSARAVVKLEYSNEALQVANAKQELVRFQVAIGF